VSLAGIACADANLTLPEGFTATVAQEGLGAGRHLVVAPNGDVYLASRNGLVAMRDSNGDGTLDKTVPFGDVKGTEVRLSLVREGKVVIVPVVRRKIRA